MNSMTPSQWLDVAILAVAFIAAISGWRSGALGSMLSFVGVLLGAIAGVLLVVSLAASASAMTVNCSVVGAVRATAPGSPKSPTDPWES